MKIPETKRTVHGRQFEGENSLGQILYIIIEHFQFIKSYLLSDSSIYQTIGQINTVI